MNNNIFTSLQTLRQACFDLPSGSLACAEQIRQRQNRLLKPQGSLGRLEELTEWLGFWQKSASPSLARVEILIFAGNHGVTAQQISSHSPKMTLHMVEQFQKGQAAINQLAEAAQATLRTIPLFDLALTADFTLAPAMSEEQFVTAVRIGYEAVDPGVNLLALGEMGIGNTTAAAALAAALFGGPSMQWVDRGASLGTQGVKHKADIVDAALRRHADILDDPLRCAQALGGFELAAMLGATLAARHHGVPVLLDGFVCTAAVAPLFRLTPSALEHTCMSHISGEQGHRVLCEKLGLPPILNLGLRLGEGSGAATAIPILRAAVACLEMATYTEE